MPIDIANMIVNIGQAQGFNWGNLLTAIIGAFATLLAAFFGAEFAFKRNAKWEKQKKEEIDKQNFKILYYMTSDLLSTFLNLQKNIIDDYYKKSKNNYTDLREYKKNMLIKLVAAEYKFNIDYSLAFLDNYNKYVIVLVNAIKQTTEFFNINLLAQAELINNFKSTYDNFQDFVNDGKLKSNIEDAIRSIKANSNILICLTYALMTILWKYKDKFLSQDEIVNIDFNQNQINVILKNSATLDAIPEYIKEGFSFFTNKRNNICPE